MKKIIQNSAGFQEVDSIYNPEYFSPEELQEIQKQNKSLVDYKYLYKNASTDTDRINVIAKFLKLK